MTKNTNIINKSKAIFGEFYCTQSLARGACTDEIFCLDPQTTEVSFAEF